MVIGFSSVYAQYHGFGFKSHDEQQRLTSLSQYPFLIFKFVYLLLTFFGVCNTRINQPPVSSACSQQPPTAPNSSQQLATTHNRLYSLDLLHFNQCLIMLFTRECLSPTPPVGLAALSLQYLQQRKIYIFGAAKKFVRHEYVYEYILYIDYTRTYFKYKNIMCSQFIT